MSTIKDRTAKLVIGSGLQTADIPQHSTPNFTAQAGLVIAALSLQA